MCEESWFRRGDNKKIICARNAPNQLCLGWARWHTCTFDIHTHSVVICTWGALTYSSSPSAAFLYNQLSFWSGPERGAIAFDGTSCHFRWCLHDSMANKYLCRFWRRASDYMLWILQHRSFFASSLSSLLVSRLVSLTLLFIKIVYMLSLSHSAVCAFYCKSNVALGQG